MDLRYLALTRRIDTLLKAQSVVYVAIDGRCGSGKSTLGAALAKEYGGRLFHMDDYYTPFTRKTPERLAQPGGNADHERMIGEIFSVQKGSAITWHRFDPQTQTLCGAETVPANRLTIIEGSYSLHEALRGYYDLRVFLDIPPEKQQARLLAREGQEGLDGFNRMWIPLEEAYFATGIETLCDIVLRYAEPGEEVREVLSEDGGPTGRIVPKRARVQGAYYRHAIVILKTTDGRYILQKRSRDTKYYPCQWDVTGGGVLAGETVAEACAREAFEELGVNVDPESLRFMLSERSDWEDGGLFIETWAGRCELPVEGLRPDPHEVSDVRITDFRTFRDAVGYNKSHDFMEMLDRVEHEI